MLESPHEVTTFQYNPLNPDIVVGGCYNGQIVVWDTSGCTPAAAAAASTSGGKAGSSSSGGGSRAGARASSVAGGGWDDSGEHEAITPVIRHKCVGMGLTGPRQ